MAINLFTLVGNINNNQTRVGAAASLGNTGRFIYCKENQILKKMYRNENFEQIGIKLVYSCWKYKEKPKRVGAAASLGNTGCFILVRGSLKKMAFKLFTLTGNINNHVDLELQLHLVIPGVS